jgi:molybdate transport system regulatory protein
MNAKFKIWLDNDGSVFGEGLYELLKGIKTTGSIANTARSLGMSNYKAYKLVNSFEHKLGYPLIKSTFGGINRGGTQLTEKGETLVEKYDKLYRECENYMEAIYKKYF